MHTSKIIIGLLSVTVLGGCVSSKEYRKSKAETAECLTDKQALQAQVYALNQEKSALSESDRAKQAEIDQLRGTYDQLVGSLKDEISNGQIQVTQLRDKLTLNMVEKILFDSGKAQIKDTGMKVLDRIGQVLKGVQDKDIRVEGYTDNVPLGPRLRERYPTNWELSTARATNVLRYLQEKSGVDPTRLIAAGFGEYHPAASNDTEEGQAENRRIDIVLVAREISSPRKAPPAATPSPATPSGEPNTP